MTTAVIGKPTSRLDGRKKVTGGATYAAEFDVPGQAHAAIVRSTIARGRIASIDAESTQRAPGVIVVLTHRNAPRLAYREHHAPVDPTVGERLHVLQDDRIVQQGQPIALVVAETLVTNSRNYLSQAAGFMSTETSMGWPIPRMASTRSFALWRGYVSPSKSIDG